MTSIISIICSSLFLAFPASRGRWLPFPQPDSVGSEFIQIYLSNEGKN